MLIDQKLYAQVYDEMRQYLQSACQHRNFGIRVLGVTGLDDLQFTQVRNLLIQYKQTYSQMEGVLFVGNIALPSFFMSRVDLPSVKYWPRYYQDLDMTPMKSIADGTSLDACQGGAGTPEGYPSNWPCIVAGYYSVPYSVPPHDFDDLRQGSSYGPELWTAFLPVGYTQSDRDNYPAWGQQLLPFFQKAAAYHQNPGGSTRNFYLLSNDLNYLSNNEALWNAIGPQFMDYYAINTRGAGLCDNNPDCYQRAPLENYSGLQAFLDYARTLAWMGEGWQDSTVFLSHMNSSSAFPRKVIFWVVHSSGDYSLISSAQAYSDINPGKGGLLALLGGCMVGTYQLPGRQLPNDLWSIPAPENNILVSLVTGNSAFISAIGSIPPRSRNANFNEILSRIYVDASAYLGSADKARCLYLDREIDNPSGYRQNWDILIGDPFMDAN